DLRRHHLWVNALYRTHPTGILRCDGRNGAHTIDPKGGKRFEISLNPSAPSGIGTSYREGFREHSPSLPLRGQRAPSLTGARSPRLRRRRGRSLTRPLPFSLSALSAHWQVTHRCQSP